MRAVLVNEREDLRKHEIIGRYADIVIGKLARYLTDVLPEERFEEGEVPGFEISPNFIFYIDVDNQSFDKGASYDVNFRDMGSTKYLTVQNSWFCGFVENIMRGREDSRSLDLVLRVMRYSVVHELVHRYDDLKYDMSRVVDKRFVKGGMTDELYVNSTTEHNAHFFAQLDSMVKGIESGRIEHHRVDTFEKFRAVFMDGLLRGSGDKITPKKWTRKMDKRMYDVYLRLKEDGRLGN